MKKILVLLVVAMCILTACNQSDNAANTIPENMNEDIYYSGKQAVRLVEDYEAGVITIEECFKDFAPLMEYVETIELAENEQESAIAIKEYINNLAYDLMLVEDHAEDLEGLKNLLGV